jgi:hypothetical protein
VRLKKFFLAVILFLLVSTSRWSPEWVVNENDFTNNKCSLLSFLNIDEIGLDYTVCKVRCKWKSWSNKQWYIESGKQILLALWRFTFVWIMKQDGFKFMILDKRMWVKADKAVTWMNIIAILTVSLLQPTLKSGVKC